MISENFDFSDIEIEYKEDGKNAIYITDRLFDAFDLIGL
jgi:hypothetical protein